MALAENTVVNVTASLSVVNCGKCGGTYAIAGRHVSWCREHGGGWTCPYCKCSWGYFGDTEADRLKKQVEQERNRLASERAQHDQTKAALKYEQHRGSAARGLVTRIKNRVSRGVCPCCNRTFANLARHMGTQHPGYAGEPS